MNGVQVPGRVVQRQAGLQTFEASIVSATPNPSNLAELRAPAPGRSTRTRRRAGSGSAATGPACAARAHRGWRLQDRRKLHRAGCRSRRSHACPSKPDERCARDGGDGGGQAGDPGQADPIVVNSHPHFDHASGLAAAVAEGATILTHRNNEQVLERFLSGSRALIGDSLSKVSIAVPTWFSKSAIATYGKGPMARSSSCITFRTSTATACSPSFCRQRRRCGRLTSRSSIPTRCSSETRASRRRRAQSAEAGLRRVDSGTPPNRSRALSKGGSAAADYN